MGKTPTRPNISTTKNRNTNPRKRISTIYAVSQLPEEDVKQASKSLRRTLSYPLYDARNKPVFLSPEAQYACMQPIGISTKYIEINPYLRSYFERKTHQTLTHESTHFNHHITKVEEIDKNLWRFINWFVLNNTILSLNKLSTNSNNKMVNRTMQASLIMVYKYIWDKADEEKKSQILKEHLQLIAKEGIDGATPEHIKRFLDMPAHSLPPEISASIDQIITARELKPSDKDYATKYAQFLNELLLKAIACDSGHSIKYYMNRTLNNYAEILAIISESILEPPTQENKTVWKHLKPIIYPIITQPAEQVISNYQKWLTEKYTTRWEQHMSPEQTEDWIPHWQEKHDEDIQANFPTYMSHKLKMRIEELKGYLVDRKELDEETKKELKELIEKYSTLKKKADDKMQPGKQLEYEKNYNKLPPLPKLQQKKRTTKRVQ